MNEIGVTGKGNVTSVKTSITGGGSITIHVYDRAELKKAIDLLEQNVEWAIVPLP